jgi:hypothetical protein
MFEKILNRINRFFLANDGKQLSITTIIQHDDCSRLFGEFCDKNLPSCVKATIVWKSKDDEAYIKTSASLSDDEAIGMLIKAAHQIGADNGTQKANIFQS